MWISFLFFKVKILYYFLLLEGKDLFNEEEGPHMEDWNPMENDFLSIRNTYSLDDEDVGSALLGQSMLISYVSFMLQ